MSTSDYSTVLVVDDRLAVSDDIKYAVMKGGQTITPTPYQAISATTSNITFNVQLPSQEVLCSREMLLRSTMELIVSYNYTGAAPSAALTQAQLTALIGYGSTSTRSCALAPFPQHSLFSVMTSTINNSSVSINIRDVLPAILRFNDKRQLSQYNSTTPVMFDTYGSYSDALGSNNNPLSGWGNSADNDINLRGSWVLDSLVPYQINGANVVYPQIVPVAGVVTYKVTFTTTEPLLLSPWIFSNSMYSNQGIYGVSVLNFVFNIGSANRVWRDSGVGNSMSYLNTQLNAINRSELLITFINPHPSTLFPARNVVPYYELPRYLTQQIPAIPSAMDVVTPPAVWNTTDVQTISTQTIMLNQIPDKLIVMVRKQMGNQVATDADCFLPIRGVSINFNSNAGILSSASAQDLYKASVRSGSNQTWYEFYGYANAPSSNVNRPVKTSGSCLILDFGTEIQLVDEYFAPGSLGTFALQLQLNVHNNTGVNIPANAYEICLITMNSGVFVTERGTSQPFTGILSKAQVLEASAGERYQKSDVQRLIGGGFFDSLKSIASKVKDFVGPAVKALAPVAKVALSNIPDARAQVASQALGALGAGTTGGRKKAIDMRI